MLFYHKFHVQISLQLFYYRAQFLEDVRKIIGVPDWMLSIDTRKTKILHSGACIQFLMHFRGNQKNIQFVEIS